MPVRMFSGVRFCPHCLGAGAGALSAFADSAVVVVEEGWGREEARLARRSKVARRDPCATLHKHGDVTEREGVSTHERKTRGEEREENEGIYPPWVRR